MKKLIIGLLSLLLLLTGCQKSNQEDGKLNIVVTTTMITDLVETIGGDHVNVKGLMTTGVDPHLYQAKASDATTLIAADLVIYNGVHLEAKLTDVLAKLENAISLESGLDEGDILADDEGGIDPHIWFSVPLWKKAAIRVSKGLSELDPTNAKDYDANLQKYLVELDELQSYITNKLSVIEGDKRVLVTAHDAFNYFAHSNHFEVRSIQGISTESEASTSTISELADFITKHQIKSVFTESSISPKTIESLQKAVESRGFKVTIGEELYSDSLKDNASYIETFKLNVDAIVRALT